MAKKKKTQYQVAVERMLKKQSDELTEQFAIVMGAMAIVMHEVYHWDNERIIKLAWECSEVWHELSSNPDRETIFEMCERETGIEVALQHEDSYHEKPYLDHTKWDDVKINQTVSCDLYILMREIKWIPAMMIACLYIGMHRQEGWEFEQLSEFCIEIDNIRQEHMKSNWYRKELKDKYDLVFSDIAKIRRTDVKSN